MNRNGKILGGLLLIVLSAGRTRADDPPAQKAPPGGKPAVAAGVPTVDLKDVIGLHLAGLAVTPAQPRAGCRVTIGYAVENRGLARPLPNVEYRTRLVANGREVLSVPVRFTPPGSRVPFSVPNVTVLAVPNRIEATLAWRSFSRHPATGAYSYGPETRIDLATLTLGPLQGGPC
jgi:hypothetical protein